MEMKCLISGEFDCAFSRGGFKGTGFFDPEKGAIWENTSDCAGNAS